MLFGNTQLINSTVEFAFGNEIANFDACSKGLVQATNAKHFPID